VTPINAFHSLILPFVHDCSPIAAEIAARQALIEFCVASEWVQFECDPLTIQAGVNTYEIETEQDQLCTRVLRAVVVDESGAELRLSFKTQDELDARYPDYRTRTGPPQLYTQIAPDEIILVPTPTVRVVAGLRMVVATQPTQDAAEVDDTLFQRWAEAIAYGARGRLKGMSGQPYYDPAAAQVEMAQFRAWVSRAKLERTRDLGRPNRTVQMREWI
jgi:hypothetical protein